LHYKISAEMMEVTAGVYIHWTMVIRHYFLKCLKPRHEISAVYRVLLHELRAVNAAFKKCIFVPLGLVSKPPGIDGRQHVLDNSNYDICACCCLPADVFVLVTAAWFT